MPTFHLIITGKVQGVFYRASAKEVAQKMGITGWIKNNMRGQVEAVVSGDAIKLEGFITWCRRGPRNAKVEEVITNPGKEQFFSGFEIIGDDN